MVIMRKDEDVPEGTEELSSLGMDCRVMHHLFVENFILSLCWKRAINKQVGFGNISINGLGVI